MKTALLLILTAALLVAVIDGGLRAWDDESAAREAMDACLAAGGMPARCMETLR